MNCLFRLALFCPICFLFLSMVSQSAETPTHTKPVFGSTPASVADLQKIETAVLRQIDHLTECTVGIHIGMAQGSGVIVSPDGLVLTAAHVVGQAGRKGRIITQNGKRYPAKVLGVLQSYDAAVMKITSQKKQKWPHVKFDNGQPVDIGHWCIATGHPRGVIHNRPPVVRLGRIVRMRKRLLHSDCTLVGGDSGGPLFDLYGNLIGIHSRIGASSEWNYHIPPESFLNHWQQLIGAEQAYAKPVDNGIAAEISSEVAEHQDRKLEAPLKKNGLQIRTLLKPITKSKRQSVVVISRDQKQRALGTVVRSDGWILSKASELTGPLNCQLHDGRKYATAVKRVFRDYDLALLKIDAKNLKPVVWKSDKDPAVGSWLLSAADNDKPLALGIVGVKRRDISHQQGVLGISLEIVQNGLRVTRVTPNSGADQAGLKAGDRITHIAGDAVTQLQVFSTKIRDYSAGDVVAIRLQREQQPIEIQAVMGRPLLSIFTRGSFQNHMGGMLSGRRSDFPGVLQHDGLIEPNECGGPVFDIKGNAVGINIARAGRTETYLVPADVVQSLVTVFLDGFAVK